jgi:hypothetical protein
MKWVYNTLAVPELGQHPAHWNDKMVWSDIKEGDIEFIADVVSKLLRELEQRLEWCFANLRKILPEKYGWKPVSWDREGGSAPSSEPREVSGWADKSKRDLGVIRQSVAARAVDLFQPCEVVLSSGTRCAFNRAFKR